MSINHDKDSVKGLSAAAQVTMQPRVMARPDTVTRTFDCLPTQMNFNGNSRVIIPMSTLVRTGSYETIKHLFFKGDPWNAHWSSSWC